MPKESKEEKKKFKAVTEEVKEPERDSSTSVGMTGETQNDMAPDVVEEKPILAVRETNNIDHNLKIKERGVFVKFFLITFFATLLAFLVAGGVYVYLTGQALGNRSVEVSQSPTPGAQTPVPSATAEASVDPATFKVSVLNGNGGIGVAGAAKAVVEKAGFKVSDVGNADNFNFTDTMIEAEASVPASTVDKLKEALSANYSVKVGDPLSAESNFDIVVTVGSK